MNIKEIQKHESPLRKMISMSHGTEYKSIKNLDEAKKIKHSYLIMEGDDRGQIYLVCPVEKIKCSQKELEVLLNDLDQQAWDDSSMFGLYYEVHNPNTVISGGMGGGMALEDLWVHKDFEKIKNKIEEVINGLTQSIRE